MRTGAGTATTRSVAAGTGITVTNGDGVAGNPTVAISNSGVTAGSYGNNANSPQLAVNAQGQITSIVNSPISISSLSVTDFTEAAQDAVLAVLTDSATIDFTYNDAGNSLTAAVIPGGVSHNSLANLTTGDAHTQYALLGGRAGGQTLLGGTALGENLVLGSTSNATKGKIFFGSSTNTVLDEVNNRLGIGNASPTYKIQAQGTTDAVITVKSTSTSSAGFLEARNDTDNYIEAGVYGSANTSTIFGDSTVGKSFLVSSAAAPMVIGQFGNQKMIFGTNSLERMNISGAGDVAIGGASAQVVLGPWSSGTASWINMPTTGPSGIGSGGAGTNPWVAYASAGGQWFTDAVSGDICYRNTTGKLLFGNTVGVSTMRVESSTVAIGVTGGAALTNNPLSVNINANSYGQSNVQNLSSGTVASGDVVATANNGTDTTNFIDMGINNSGFADPGFTINGPNDGYLYINGGDLSIGCATANKIVFFTGDTLAANEIARFTPTGQLAVGVTAPNAAAKVQIDSTTQGFLMPRVTTTQMEAISSPPQGMMVFNTTYNAIATYSGTRWLFTLWQVVQNNQSSTSTTYADITELVTPSLPVGRYVFRFNGTAQSTATTTGVGFRLASATTGGAVLGALVGQWSISQAAAGTDKNYEYSQLSATDNVTSASVVTANADFPIIGEGVFSITTAGAMAVQLRTEVGASGVSVRINSAIEITRLNG